MIHRRTANLLRLATPAMAGLFCALAIPARAQTQYFWRGDAGLNGNWNASDKWWTNAPAPAGFGQLNFNNNDYLVGTNDSAFSTWRIYFDAAASQARTNGGTGQITFYDSSGALPLIRNDSTATHILNMPMRIGNLSGDRRLEIIAANGDLTFGGQFTTEDNGGGGERLLFVTNGTGRLVTMSGVITEANANSRMRLQKEGSGTLTLSGTGANTHTGGITLNGGTLILNKSAGVNAVGPGALTIGSGTTVSAQAVSQFGSSFVNNFGTLNFNNNNQQMALGGSGIVNLGTATLTNTNSGDDTFSGQITSSGASSLIKAGAGTLRLTGTSSTYTGPTTILGGMLAINGDGSLGAAPVAATANKIVLSNATLGFNAGLTLNANRGMTLNTSGTLNVFSGNTVTYNGIIAESGTSILDKAGSGTLVLGGNNTFTGATTIGNGAVRATSATAFGATAGGVSVSSGAAVELSGTVTVGAEALTLNGDGINFAGSLRSVSGNNVWQGTISNAGGARINSDANTLTLSAINSGTNNLYFGGAGNITVGGLIAGTQTQGNGALYKDGSGVLTLSAANTGLTGLVRVLGGTVSIAAANNIGSGTVEIGGTGTLLTTADLTRTAGLTVTDASGGAVINVASGTSFIQTGAFTGAPTASTKIGKAGAGSLIFNAASGSTFGGQIQIGDGTLVAGTTGALGANNSIANRGIDLGFNVGDVSQANNVALRASNGVTVGQSIYVAPNTGNALRTIGLAGAGAATFSNQFYLDGTLTVDGGANATDLVTISGGVVNTGGLNKIGSGTVILSGVNTYSGQTTVSNGVLILANGSALSDAGVLQLDNTSGASATVAQSETIGSLRGGGASGGNLSIASVANLTVAEATNQNYAGAIGGSGALTMSGVGQLNLSGANTYGGLTTISSGSLEAQSASALGSTNGATVVSSGANLKLFGGGSGISYDAEAVTLNGLGPAYGDVGGDAGALRSVGGGNNTWNGAITLGSSARINSDSAGGAGSLTIAGNIAGGNNVLFVGTKSSNNANMTISGALGGAGALQANTTTSLFKDGASTLTLSGNNTFSGDTRISAGNLTVASGGTLGNGTSDVYISAAGSLTVNANATIASLREWGNTNGGTATIGTGATLTVSGNDWSDYMNSIGGAGNLVKSGTGTMNLYGTQSYSGTTTVSGGKLSTGVALASSGVTVSGGNFETTAANILGDTVSVTVNSGTYNLRSDDTIGALSGTGGAINLSTNRLTTTVSSGSSSYTGGSISGAGGGLTKAGNGTFSLGGTHSYTGGTTVSGGELRLVGATLSASSSVSVSSGAKLGGYGSTGVLGGAGSIDPGNSPGILTTTQVNPSGELDFNFEFTGLTPVFNAPDASVNDLVRITGTTPFSQSLNGANIINVYFSGDALYTGGAAKQIKGGFFTDQQANFFSSISGATYNYYFAMSGGGTIYNGQNYMTQTQYQTSTGFNLTITTNTFAQAASFDGTTTINGQIVQFEVIPEPTTYALLALSGIALGVHTYRRRFRKRAFSSRD